MKVTLSILALLGCISMLNAALSVPAACLSAFMASALNQTNFYRARHGAGPLTEDATIRTTSQEWATYLSDNNLFQHNTAKLSTLGYGENLAMNYAFGSASTLTAAACAKSASEAVDMWYNEVKDYNYQTGGFAMNTGHFTQLVWKSSTKVGHGVAFAVDPNYPSYTKVILCADYQSPGNYAGQFQVNVLPPTSSAQTTVAPTVAPTGVSTTLTTAVPTAAPTGVSTTLTTVVPTVVPTGVSTTLTTAAPTAASTTKAASSTNVTSTSITTDLQASAALAKPGTTVVLIWNSVDAISKTVKAVFDTISSQYTNLNFIAADTNAYAGGNMAILSSQVLKYSDYSVGGSLSPPTLVAYANGVKNMAPASLSKSAYPSLITEAYIQSAGGVKSASG